MMLRAGDRVRVRRQSDPAQLTYSYEYGYVESIDDTRTNAVVLLDDDLTPRRVALVMVSPVDIATLELCLDADRFERSGGETALRDELVVLWQDEAEQAGLDIERLVPLPTGSTAGLDTWALAELHAGGVRFLLRARFAPAPPRLIHVHAAPHYPEN